LMSTPCIRNALEISKDQDFLENVPCPPILILECMEHETTLDGYSPDTMPLVRALRSYKIPCIIQFFEATKEPILKDMISSGNISCILSRISPDSLRRAQISLRRTVNSLFVHAENCDLTVYEGVPPLKFELFSENFYYDLSNATHETVVSFASDLSKHLHQCRAREIFNNPHLLDNFSLSQYRSKA